MHSFRFVATLSSAALTLVIAATAGAQTNRLLSSDMLKLRSVGEVQFSADGKRLAYVVINNDGPGRPYSQVWIMTLANGKSIRPGGESERSSNPVWSPDGQWIAYQGGSREKSGLTWKRAKSRPCRRPANG